MPKVAQVIGGAGTGKTSHLMKLLDWWVTTGGVAPRQIGFISFTKAARQEAAERAAKLVDIPAAELEKDGWFRTLHACCFKLLGIKSAELISDSKADRQWLSKAIQDEVSGTADVDENAGTVVGKCPADAAMSLWESSRNKLLPLQEVWERAYRCDERTPDLEYCRLIVERYEQAKRLDNRCDYTDMLSRFCGLRHSPEGHSDVPPEGVPPMLPLWFLDEAQDNSALTDRAARRLTQDAEWVYVVGDPFQAIFSFAGSDPAHFQSWPVTEGHRRILDQTYRCPAPVLELGERILSVCSDYWDRGIKPAPHAGSVELVEYQSSDWINQIDPTNGETWLLLARTNFLAARLAKRIDATGIPWVPVKGHGCTWAAPSRNTAIRGLLSLEGDGIVLASEWQEILKVLPAKAGGTELFRRGTKTEWEQYLGEPDAANDLNGLPEWGASDALAAWLRAGKWREHVEHAAKFCEAWTRYGHAAVLKPLVRVGTIHATKGMEADNVLLLTTITHQVRKSMEDVTGADEEWRVWYVGATRTKKRLFVAREFNASNKMELPI